MIQLIPQLRIRLACQPIDFRNGIDGLAALCQRALEEDPTLSRELSNVTVNFLENNACVVRFTSTTRHGANPPEAPQKYVLTANYVLSQAKNERELEQAGNPLGLSITHFTIARETER